MRVFNRLDVAVFLYIVMPVLLFMLGWFQPWIAIVLSLLAISLCWRPLRKAFSVPMAIPAPVQCLALLLALLFVLLSGTMGGVATHELGDWVKHDAMFLDLIKYPWPLVFEQTEQGPEFLRYYIAFYVPAALLGKLTGLAVLNVLITAWMTLGTWLLLLIFAQTRSVSSFIVASVLLFFFSGMDILRIAFFEDLGNIPLGGSILEWAYGITLNVQYTSNMIGFNIVPQHFLPAALAVSLLLSKSHDHEFLGVVGVFLACLPLWSPFIALGILPLFVALLCADRHDRVAPWRALLRPANLLAAPAIFLALAIYLTAGTADFTRAWIWDIHSAKELFKWMPAFLLFQFGALAMLLWVARRELRRDPVFIVAVLSLLLIPWFSYGVYNDFAMRVSFPALLVLCWYTRDVLTNEFRRLALGLQLALLAVLALGAVTPVHELARVLVATDHRYLDYRKVDRAVKKDTYGLWLNQYMGYAQTPLSRYLLRLPKGDVE